jgi:hypothetical protein
MLLAGVTNTWHPMRCACVTCLLLERSFLTIIADLKAAFTGFLFARIPGFLLAAIICLLPLM